jgi:hypothetical protein
MGYEVVVVPPYQLDGGPVRSARIRAEIAACDLAEAARLLGRGHAVVGELGHDGRMRFAMPVALPPDGRYLVRVATPWAPGWHGRSTTARIERGDLRLPAAGSRARVVRVAFHGTRRPRHPVR